MLVYTATPPRPILLSHCSCSLLEILSFFFFCFVFLPLSSSYPVEGGGLPTKAKKRSSISNGSIKKLEARKALSLEAAQLEIQQQHKTLTRQVAIR